MIRTTTRCAWPVACSSDNAKGDHGPFFKASNLFDAMTTQHSQPDDTSHKALNKEYSELSKQEELLVEMLTRLEKEERVLKQALKEACETGAQRLQQQRQAQEASALSRLEQALMESSSSEDEDNNNHNDAQSLFSMGGATKASKTSRQTEK